MGDGFPILTMTYFDTYWVSSMVSEIIRDPFPFLRKVHELYENLELWPNWLIKPYQQRSLLHCFIGHAIDTVLDEYLDLEAEAIAERRKDTKWLERGLVAYGIDHVPFLKWAESKGTAREDICNDHIVDWWEQSLGYEDKRQEFIDRTIEEVFFLLFLDRELLRSLHDFASFHVRGLAIEDVPAESACFFESSGRLRRVKPPQWAQRAVFYRDRGKCVLCRRDLSGLLGVDAKVAFDHVVPLARGGLNDVTNLQLLCQKCNLEKQAGRPVTSNWVQCWYPPPSGLAT